MEGSAGIAVSFVPEEDYGSFVNVQLPPAASLERTDEVCRKIERVLSDTQAWNIPRRSPASAR
jgi:HAE1 family hydrophobic/amphiphilic exporter-1